MQKNTGMQYLIRLLLILFSSNTIFTSDLSTNLDITDVTTENSIVDELIDELKYFTLCASLVLGIGIGGYYATKKTHENIIWPRLVLYGKKYLNPNQFYNQEKKNELLTTVQWLLNKGFNPDNFVDYCDNTLMHYALENEHEDLIKLLAEKNAYPYIMNDQKKTCISQNMPNYKEKLRLYLQYFNTIDINAPVDVHGNTLLYYVLNHGTKKQIKLIAQKGANPNYLNNFGKHSLCNIIKKFSVNLEKIETFLKSFQTVNVNTPVDEHGNTLLYHALWRTDEKIIKLLSEKGANPHLLNYQDQIAICS